MGNDPGLAYPYLLSQDMDKKLSTWFATRANAKQEARNVSQSIKEQHHEDIHRLYNEYIHQIL